MKVLLATVVALTTAIVLCSAADPECKERERKGLPLHWPNPTDCGRFYRCTTKNVKREVICPPEREYNQKTGKCALRGKGVCTPMIQMPVPLVDDADVCIGKSDATNIPVPGTCRDFYVCANEVAIQQSCLIGSVFNTTEDACVPDPTATCWQNACNGLADDTILADSTSCLNYYQCEANDVNVQTCLAGDYFNITDRSCIADVGYTNCWENFCINETDSTYVPKPGTCRDFYVCANKLANPQSCLIGSIFNTTAKACVPDPTATCWQNACNGLADDTILADPTSCLNYYQCEANDVNVQTCLAGDYFNVTYGSCTADVGYANCWENFCINEPDNTCLPKPGTCRDFYVCANKLANPQSCPIGSIFNTTVNSCELDPTATCWQNACNGLADDTILADPTSCLNYYQCEANDVNVQTCLAGDYFNVTYGSCTADVGYANCWENFCINEPDNTYLPKPGTCRDFYVCANKLANPQSCPIGSIFNTTVNSCELDPTATCWQNACNGLADDTILADPTSCLNYYQCEANDVNVQTCLAGDYFNVTYGSCTADVGYANCWENFCINEPDNTYLPKPGTCRDFYVCANKLANPQSCPIGSIFNTTVNSCELDPTATCWQNACNGLADDTILADPTSCLNYYQCEANDVNVQTCLAGDYFNVTYGSCTADVGYANCWENFCINEPDNTYLPKPGTCRDFYVCANKLANPQSCPIGSIFNTTVNSCELDPTATCWQNACNGLADDTILADPTSCLNYYQCEANDVNVQTCLAGDYFNVTYGSCTADVGYANCWENFCINEPDNTYLPKPGTCRDFYVCANKLANPQSCPIGSIFNTTVNSCELDPTATCWQNACNGLADDTILADPTSCLNYYQCEANDVNVQTCLAGDYFNVTYGSCTADVGYANCWENFCINETDNTYLPKPGSCRDFYVCANKLANPQSCSIGSIFNTTANSCELDPTATCWQNACNGLADGIILADANSCTSYYECKADDVVVKTCPAGNYFDNTTLSCLEGECPVETCSCPGGYNEGDMIQHPTDCNSFYICINRELLEQSCQPGNYFDCEKNACMRGDCAAVSNNVHARKSRSSFLDITNLEADIEDNDDVITIDEDTLEPSYDQQTFKVLDEAIESSDQLISKELDEAIEPSNQLISKELDEAIDDTDAVQPLEENLKLSNSSVVIVSEIHNVPIEIEIPPPVVTPEPFKWEAAMELMCLDRYYEGDIIADPDNCQQYKVCLNAQFIVESCGTGARFDEDLLVCQRDEDDACSKTLIKKIVATTNGLYDCTCPGGYTGGQRLPHADCDKYYICNGENGTLQEQKCGVGNFYNKATELCDVDTTGDCWPLDECTCPGDIQPWAQVAHPSVCRMYYICDGSNGTLRLSDCGAGNRFDNDTKLCVEDTCALCNPPADICKDQTNNTLVANPTECFSFYLCINNEPTLGVCNETEWFDPFYGKCTVDTNAQCRNPCESISGIMFLPHPDCTKFYFCNDGVATVTSCDPDQSFNATLNMCRPGTSNCGGAAVCTGQPDGTYFPVTDDDTKFYYCLNGTGIVTDCLPGTTFNPKLEICLLQPSDNCDKTICATEKDGFIAPTIDHQSASFCECRDGEGFLVNCLDGYTFNETELICTTNASCDPAICPYSPDYTYFPNKNDMHSFCLCITNEALIIDCPKNGTYNPSIMECQLPAPQDPNCNPTECLIAPPYFAFPSLTADDNTTFCICVDGGATLLDCPTGYTFNETLGICYSDVPPFDITLCQGNETFFPVPNNIYAFYYCSDANTVQLINCPVNTVYDQKYKACLEDPCDQTVCEDPAMLDSPYAALGNPYIFCMCEEVTAGSTNLHANWYACDPNTMFSPKYNVCLSESINPDCDVALCNVDDFVGLTIPAINDPYGFCYCTSTNTAVKYSCNDGMKYNAIKGVCAHDLLCNGKYTQFEVTANPEACNKYYLCFDGDLLNLTCNTGLYFNTTALNCLPNDKNQCILLDDDCTCPGGYKAGDFLPHPTDCSLYYICSAGKLVQTPCGPNNYFDIVSKTCQKDVTGCCPASATRTCVGNYREGEFVPHPTSSQSYYICTNARLMPASCGLGNVFDRKLQTCTKAPKTLTSNYKWKRSSSFDEMQDVRTLFNIKPMIKKLTGSFGNLFA